MGDGIGVGVGQGGFSGSSGDGHGVGETVGDGVGVCQTFAALTSVSISLKLFPIAIAAITTIGSINVLTRSDLIVNLPGLDLTVSRFVPPSPQRVAITVPREVNHLYLQKVTRLGQQRTRKPFTRASKKKNLRSEKVVSTSAFITAPYTH